MALIMMQRLAHWPLGRLIENPFHFEPGKTSRLPVHFWVPRPQCLAPLLFVPHSAIVKLTRPIISYKLVNMPSQGRKGGYYENI